ncbi:MAG: alpha-L-rhamnosidase [Chloroflexaceae bacterium]|nr:alpha-L-rhamnosidase [Chloroflexaceae bacterium]
MSDASRISWSFAVFMVLVGGAWLVGLAGIPRVRGLRELPDVASPASSGLPESPASASSCAPALAHAMTETTMVHLPFVLNSSPDSFSQNTPIWSHAEMTATHEVTLFRRGFSLDSPMAGVTLAIFADTRYEVWIDGVWVGRGPARFSQHTREYDRYALGTLQPGPHLVAVLVQWAPNFRRSESVAPALQAHIEGTTRRGEHLVFERTGPHWKALLSTAWQQDGALVHAWGLIGPTELLDLRLLPRTWMMPSFVDASWPAAVPGAASAAAYQPRSIPFLVNVPMTVNVWDIGRLAPGQQVGELLTTTSPDHPTAFEVVQPVTITIETIRSLDVGVARLPGSEGAAETLPVPGVYLDDEALAPDPASTPNPDQGTNGGTTRHPDVLRFSRHVLPGVHHLSLTGQLAQVWPVSVSSQQTQSLNLPLQQGNHAGRRLLLAEPVRQPEAVAISRKNGLDLTFTSLPSYAVLDLGRVVHGRLVAEVSGPSGTIVDIGWDERLWQGKRPLPFPGSLHQEWNQTDSWVLDGTIRPISTLDTRAGRYILVAVWGAAQSAVHLQHIQVYEERYLDEQRGEFHSSSERLNQIWQVGVETLYPNMTDAYADPWRERGQWWGDAFAVDHVNQVVSGDACLLRRGLWFMAEAFDQGQPTALAPNGGKTLLLDYGMLWVLSLDDYWRLTADAAFLSQVYPALVDLLAYLETYENATTHLLDIPVKHWSGRDQIVLIDWAASTSWYGQSTALNALYYATLLKAADLAEHTGDASHARTWRRKAGLVRDQINLQLYRPEQGRYVATIVNGTAYAPTPQAQAWTLAYGLVPEGEQQRVADALLELLSPDPSAPNVEIYGMYWVLEALGQAQRLPDALEVIERYYGYLLDRGATTWWEGFTADRHYWAALSHGWGGAPTWFLTTWVLGARRTVPIPGRSGLARTNSPRFAARCRSRAATFRWRGPTTAKRRCG